jgi:hypothetical protein
VKYGACNDKKAKDDDLEGQADHDEIFAYSDTGAAGREETASCDVVSISS